MSVCLYTVASHIETLIVLYGYLVLYGNVLYLYLENALSSKLKRIIMEEVAHLQFSSEVSSHSLVRLINFFQHRFLVQTVKSRARTCMGIKVWPFLL